MIRRHPFRTLSIAFFTLFSISSCSDKKSNAAQADKKSNDVMSATSSRTISPASSAEATSFRALLLPQGIAMTDAKNFSSDEARNAAPGISDSASYLGAFKLEGSVPLNGQEIKVEVNNKQIAFILPEDPLLESSVEILVFNDNQSSSGLGLTADATEEANCSTSTLCAVGPRPGLRPDITCTPTETLCKVNEQELGKLTPRDNINPGICCPVGATCITKKLDKEEWRKGRARIFYSSYSPLCVSPGPSQSPRPTEEPTL